MDYILDRHQDFSTILLVTMLFIAMIRSYICKRSHGTASVLLPGT